MTRKLLWTVLLVAGSAAADELETVDGAEITALRLSAELGATYAEAARTAPTDLDASAKALLATLSRLEGLEAKVDAIDDPAMRAGFLAARARAWVHGWVVLGAYARALPRTGAPAARATLVGMDPRQPSCLRKLLSILGAVARHAPDAGTTADAPLAIALGRDREWAALIAWDPGKRGLPSVTAWIGEPDHPEPPASGFPTLWSVVYAQLDALGGDATAPLPDRYGAAATWVAGLASSADARALDRSGDFRSWLQRISAYLRFREAVVRDGNLETIVDEIASQREARAADGAAARNKERDAVKLLSSSAVPVSGRRLADAAIWLRYLFLVGYRNAGLAAATGDASGVEPAWKRWYPDDPDFLRSLSRPEKGRIQTDPTAFLRAAQHPIPGQFVRALADATSSALAVLQVQGDRTASDFLRLGMYRLEDVRRAYRERLERWDGQLDGAVAALGPHLALKEGGAAEVQSIRTGFWDASASDPERRLLADDVVVLAQSAGALLRQTREALPVVAGNTRRSDVDRVLVALAATSTVGDWNVAAYPAQTWQKLSRRVNDGLQRAEDTARKGASRDEARLRVEVAAQAYRKALDDAMAVLQNERIKDAARAVADHVVRLAEIDAEIAALGVDVAALSTEYADFNAQAARLGTERALRLKELAVARVQALNAALEKGHELVEQAQGEVQAQRDKLLALADQIENQKNKDAFWGIVKGIVNVVGVALAPFTGGASLAVATVVSRAVDVARVATDARRWNDFSSGLGAVLEIAQTSTGAIQVGLKTFSTDDAVKSFNEFRTALLDKGQTAVQLGTAAEAIVKHINSKDQLWTIAACAARSFPTRIENGAIVIGIAREQLTLKLPSAEVETAFRGLLQVGGQLSEAVSWTEEQARRYAAEPRKFLEDGLKQLPDEVLAKAGVDPAKARKQFESLRTQLEGALDRLPPSDRASAVAVLQELHRTGAVLVTDAQGRIVALQRDVAGELDGIRVELEAAQKRVFAGAVHDVMQRVQEATARLERQAAEAQQAQDQDELRRIARSEIPATVQQIGSSLDQLKGDVEKAQEEAKTKQQDLDIALLQNRAAAILVQKSRKEAEVASALVRRAQEEAAIAVGTRDVAAQEVARAAVMLASANRDVAIRRSEYLFAIQRAVAEGVDPFSGDPQTAAPGGIRSVLASLTAGTDAAAIAEVASAVVEMIKWVGLLQPGWSSQAKPPAPDGRTTDPVRLYAALVGCVKQTARGDAGAAARSCLKKLADTDGEGVRWAWGQVNKVAATPPVVQRFLSASDVVWTRTADGGDEARFVFRFTYDPSARPRRGYTDVKRLEPALLYYAALYPADGVEGKAGTVFVMKKDPKDDDLALYRFEVFPPSRSCADAASALPDSLAPAVARGRVIQSFTEERGREDAVSSILSDFSKRDMAGLRPLEGDWTIRLRREPGPGSGLRKGTLLLEFDTLQVPAAASSEVAARPEVCDSAHALTVMGGAPPSRPPEEPRVTPGGRGCHRAGSATPLLIGAAVIVPLRRRRHGRASTDREPQDGGRDAA